MSVEEFIESRGYCKKRRGTQEIFVLSSDMLKNKKVMREKFTIILPPKMLKEDSVKIPSHKQGIIRKQGKKREIMRQKSISLHLSSDRRVQNIIGSLSKIHSIPAIRIQQSISHSSDYSLITLSRGLSMMKPYLMEVRLTKPWAISDLGIQKFSSALSEFHNLKVFHMTIESNQVSNEGLKIFGKNLELLKALSNFSINFVGCHNISNDGVLEFSKSLRLLTKLAHFALSFDSCINLDEKILRLLSRFPIRFQDLDKLSIQILGNKFRMNSQGSRTNSLRPLSLELEFKRCIIVSDNGLTILGNHIKEMKSISNLSLSFQGCSQITAIHLEEFLNSLKAIKKLTSMSLNCDSSLGSSDSLSFLHQNWDLNNLSLKFRYTSKHSDGNFSNIFQNFHKMKNLELHFKQGEGDLTDGDFKQLVTSLQDLNKLSQFSLNCSINSLSYSSFSSFCHNMNNFKSLNVLDLTFHQCHKIGDSSLYEFSSSLKELTALKHLGLNFDNSSLITDDGLAVLFENIYPIRNLNSLNLKFKYLDKIRGKAFFKLAPNTCTFPKLTKMNIGFLNCRGLKDEGVEAICSSLRNLEALEEFQLHLIHCRNISDLSLKIISSSLAAINFLKNVELDFSLCDNITSLEFLAFTSFIKELQISAKISSNFVWPYTKNCL